MIEWKKDMLLYHGSYCAVHKPELEKCSPYKDFGRGFYVTTSKKQAERFVPSAIRKAVRFGTLEDGRADGVVTVYRFTLPSSLTLCEFDSADIAWLHCVAALDALEYEGEERIWIRKP